MPLETELERRQADEIIRLSEELARKTAIIAELQAANIELHERLITCEARAELTQWIAPPRRVPPHVCAGCGSEIAAEAVAWAHGATWTCVECMQRG